MDSSILSEIQARLLPADSPLENPSNLRRAGVLAVMYEDSHELLVPLIQRPSGQRMHAGQLALPGGGEEVGDESLLDTALREAREEVSLDSTDLQILGRLPAVLVRISGYVVAPFVAWTPRPPLLTPNESEVESIVELNTAILADPEWLRELPAPAGSTVSTVYEYRLTEGRLWGATARMMYALGSVLKSAGAYSRKIQHEV